MRMSLLAGCVALLSTSAMAAEPSPAFPAEPEHGFPSALAPAYITDLQQQLTAHGYYAGPLDGRMNGALRAAVSVYQSDVGLRVTGVPDLAVVNMLHFGPDVHATIQPLGAPTKAVAAVLAPPRGGVPPYDKPEPYRYPAADAPAEEADVAAPIRCDGAVEKSVRAERRTSRNDEPPPPKPAPQARVVAQPLAPSNR